jgi:hypothetical protein
LARESIGLRENCQNQLTKNLFYVKRLPDCRRGLLEADRRIGGHPSKGRQIGERSLKAFEDHPRKELKQAVDLWAHSPKCEYVSKLVKVAWLPLVFSAPDSHPELGIQKPFTDQRLFPALTEAGGAGGISLQLTELNGLGVAAAVAGVGAPSASGFDFFVKPET